MMRQPSSLVLNMLQKFIFVMSVSQGVWPLFLPCTAMASASDTNKKQEEPQYTSVGSIAVSDGVKLNIASIPDLQARKLSQLKVTIQFADKKDQSVYELMSFDADMPAHKHGMVVKASRPEKIKSPNENQVSYLIEGVKLHMPGEWVLHLEVQKKGAKEPLKLRFPVQVRL